MPGTRLAVRVYDHQTGLGLQVSSFFFPAPNSHKTQSRNHGGSHITHVTHANAREEETLGAAGNLGSPECVRSMQECACVRS